MKNRFTRTMIPVRYHISGKQPTHVKVCFDIVKGVLTIRTHGTSVSVSSGLLSHPEAYINRPFTIEMIQKFNEYWPRWSDNDMRCGTPRQEEAIRQHYTSEELKRVSYEDVCRYLEGIGLLEDNGIKYGTQWNLEPVPLEVLEFFFNLPGEGATFEDVKTGIEYVNMQIDFKEILALIM